MTDACPPKAQLDRFLADQLTKGEEEAMVAHVAGCSECQRRLEQLTRGELTFSDRPSVRQIVRGAAGDDYRWSALILGVVKSPTFLMYRPDSGSAGRTARREPTAAPADK